MSNEECFDYIDFDRRDMFTLLDSIKHHNIDYSKPYKIDDQLIKSIKDGFYDLTS